MVKILMGPLVEQCPANLEYSVVHILSLGNGSFIVGRIEETHVSENYLTDVKPDANKIKPFISTAEPDRQYTHRWTGCKKSRLSTTADWKQSRL